MDRLDAMQLFVRIAEVGSFSAVATQMNVARSIVTRQIAALERHLGVKLLVRSTRHVALTSAGAAYLEKCRVILNLVESAETDLAEENQRPRGHLRVSLPLSFGLKILAPVLLDFSLQYPEVSLDMDYSDRHVNLVEEGIDLSIRIARRLAPNDVARRLGTTRLCVVAAPEYLQRHGRPRHPNELPNHVCLGYLAGNQLAPWQFQIGDTIENVSIISHFNTNNGDVLAEAAARGLGITCQPDFIVAPALAAGTLVTLLDDFPIPERGIYAMLPGNRQIPHRVRVLMDFLAQRLGGFTAGLGASADDTAGIGAHGFPTPGADRFRAAP